MPQSYNDWLITKDKATFDDLKAKNDIIKAQKQYLLLGNAVKKQNERNLILGYDNEVSKAQILAHELARKQQEEGKKAGVGNNTKQGISIGTQGNELDQREAEIIYDLYKKNKEAFNEGVKEISPQQELFNDIKTENNKRNVIKTLNKMSPLLLPEISEEGKDVRRLDELIKKKKWDTTTIKTIRDLVKSIEPQHTYKTNFTSNEEIRNNQKPKSIIENLEEGNLDNNHYYYNYHQKLSVARKNGHHFSKNPKSEDLDKLYEKDKGLKKKLSEEEPVKNFGRKGRKQIIKTKINEALQTPPINTVKSTVKPKGLSKATKKKILRGHLKALGRFR